MYIKNKNDARYKYAKAVKRSAENSGDVPPGSFILRGDLSLVGKAKGKGKAMGKQIDFIGTLGVAYGEETTEFKGFDAVHVSSHRLVFTITKAIPNVVKEGDIFPIKIDA